MSDMAGAGRRRLATRCPLTVEELLGQLDRPLPRVTDGLLPAIRGTLVRSVGPGCLAGVRTRRGVRTAGLPDEARS